MVYALLVSAHCWEYCVTPFSARSVGDGWIRNGVSRYYDVTECNSVWWNVFEQSVFFLPSFYIYFYPLVLSTPLPHSLSLTPYLARSLSLRYFECLFSMWLQTPSGRVMVPHIYLNANPGRSFHFNSRYVAEGTKEPRWRGVSRSLWLHPIRRVSVFTDPESVCTVNAHIPHLYNPDQHADQRSPYQFAFYPPESLKKFHQIRVIS